MKRIFPILLLLLLGQPGLSAQTNATLEQRLDGLWYVPGKEQPYTGTARKRHLDGTKISEASYRAGQQHGLTRFWYNNGKLRSSFNYTAGQLDGNSTYFYRRGNRQNLTTYRAGKKHGPTIDWWPEGKKSFEEHYVDGFPEGRWRSWWPNGKLASEKIYRKRKLTSRREWSRDGTSRQLSGWNLNGTVKTAASLRQRQQVLGRRMLWNRVSGPNRIDLIYRGKPLATLRKVFGDPDETDDGRWIYKGLRIQDPTNGERYDTAIFAFKKGRVTEIFIE